MVNHMESIRNIYKIGNGPSSSHTMGPQKAASIFLERNKNATRFIVNLYGSLALTGKGHLTDYIIIKTLGKDKTEVKFNYSEFLEYHPNGMTFTAYENDNIIDFWRVYSIGGGNIVDESSQISPEKDIYPYNSMKDILDYCRLNSLSLYSFIMKYEAKEVLDYLDEVIDVMISSVDEGLTISGDLPGSLHIKRRAKDVYDKYLKNNDFDTLLFASTLACIETNASGGKICTAPTCGSCGVIAGIVYSFLKVKKYSRKQIKKGLLIAGLIGDLIKTNASISGAEVGCQGEVGAACSMASAMVAYLAGGTNEQIEYAAEIGLEHYLGMTCDPVGGYVQIPCIERNAISAKRAIDCSNYALLSDGNHYISLDHVIRTMKETGLDLHKKYRETSLGGLACEKID